MAKIKGGTVVLKVGDDGTLRLYEQKTKKAKQAVDKLGTSAHTADRRLKGAAQASSGGSKNFSKMAQGINGGLVPAYATLAASLFAIGALFRGLEEAANIKNQTKGMEIFGEATGIAMKGIVADLRAATGGMLDFRTAAQQAQIATAAGFSGDQIMELGKGAKLASVALGRDLTDSFNRLLRGVTKAEPELLDELGIILRIDDATRKYAQANDLVASKLTISQRRAAVFEEVSRQLANNFGAFEEGADGALNSFSKLQVAFSDILKGLTAFIGPLESVAEFLAQNTGAAALLFAGFASSIMKSAFPALNNLQAALLAYKAKSESALRAEKVKFTQYGLMFKKNAAEANMAELKKSATFRKFLKKRGMDEEAFNAKSLVNQRRSISLMIANLQKRAAAGKAINDAELAYFIKTRNQMVGVQAGIGAKLVGIAGATGAALGAAITVPALLARLGLAKLGAAALALGPIFATLGAIISGAFTIFTVGFLAKFLYDILFVTKEEKEERAKILEILKTTELKLQEINRIGSKLFASATEEAIDNVDKLNNRLLATYNLIQGLSGRTSLEKTIGDKQFIREESDAAAIASVFMQRFAALGSLGGADDLRAVLAAANEQLGPEYMRGFISDLNFFMKKYQEGGVLTEDGQTVLMENLTKAILNMNTQEVFAFFDSLKQRTDQLATPGEGLYNVSEAAKEVKDSLAVMMDGYKPTSFDTLSSSLQKLQTNFSDAMAKGAKGNYAAVLKKQLGLSFESDQQALDFVLERAAAVETIIARNAQVLDVKNKIETKVAGLGSRKDAFADLEKKRLKELDLANKVGEIQNNIRKEQEVLNLLGRDATEIEERKLRGLERQLLVIQAQEKEYKRANTIAGQLQDTFQDGLDDMFLSIINGTASAKDAFKQLAVVVIQEMQRILAVRMASQIIGMMTGMFGSGLPDTSGPGPHMSPVDTSATTNPFGSTLPSTGNTGPFGRYGGVYGKGYNTGGIADGPQSGYNVIMHGREAIVPLPDGDKIPVQLSGKGMGPTNTTINVVVNNEGEAEATVEESTAFAEAVQLSVMQTIAEQQRPGGLLNPGG
jgi:hypothetical protein